MAEIWMRRVGNALFPDGDESIAELTKLPFGKSMRVTTKLPRNARFHRLYFAVCARIAGGVGQTSENISDVLKIATGHYTTIKSKTHGEIRIPKSIAFQAMTQTDFNDFYERCLVVIFSEWGIERAALSDLIDMAGTYGN